jgi:hypothetical protein
MIYSNGAGTAIPETPTVITGASLVHRHLNKRQRAVLAANVVDGLARFVPTNRQVADIFGVSQGYIDAARRLSPDKRKAILSGRDSTSFVDLLNGHRQLALPSPQPVIDDARLIDVIRAAGIERTLAAAVAVERA